MGAAVWATSVTRVPFSVRLDEELLGALRARAEREDRSVGWLIERACEAYLGPPGALSYHAADVVGDASTREGEDPETNRQYVPREDVGPAERYPLQRREDAPAPIPETPRRLTLERQVVEPRFKK